MSRRHVLKLLLAGSLTPLLSGHSRARASRLPATSTAVASFGHQADSRLRVISYNVWGVPTSTERAVRMTAIGQKLASMDLDLVCLQECWFEADRQRLLAGLKDSALRHIHFYPAGLMGSGLMILSRFRIVDVGFHRYSLNGQPLSYPEVDYYGGKGIGYAVIDTPSGEVAVFNTHIIARYGGGPDDLFYAHRAAQAYEFARFVNAHAGDRPVIALGDFNLTPDKLGYQIVDALGALTNSYEEIHGRDSYFGGLIDHVFLRDGVGRGLTPTTVDASPLTSSPSTNLERLSDHPAVIIDMSFTESQGPTDPDASTLSALLTELLDVLERGIEDAVTRARDHDLRAGLSLAAFIGAEASSGELTTHRPVWGRALRLAGLTVALPLALAQAWLGLLVSEEEINALRRVIHDVRILIGRVR